MVLSVYVGFRHDVLYLVDSRLELSILEDRSVNLGGITFHRCRWGGGSLQRDDGIDTNRV